MTALATTVAALVFGLCSALLPALNAEAYVLVVAARTDVWLTISGAIALALGQTAGKLVLFELARRGSGVLTRRARKERKTLARWSASINERLTKRRTGIPLVLTAASIGLPPLAAVSLAAGASAQRRCEFAAACLIGRIARFGAIAVPAAMAMAG